MEEALEDFGKEREEQLADLQQAIDDLESTAMEKLETEIEAARELVENAIGVAKEKMDEPPRR